jgi:hypothetical protein
MFNKRNAITVYDEDVCITYIKPTSLEYNNQLIVIYEDAYGEITSGLEDVSEIKKGFSGCDEEFDELLLRLA